MTSWVFGSSGSSDPQNAQVEQWFAAVDQDRTGRITAVELQRGLANTYWCRFSEDTCRLMVGMFDKDGSGTIDLSEFKALWKYIQDWKKSFDSYDTYRTGSIEGPALHQAFGAMGYHVSYQFVQTVLAKYDHYARRSLTFENFIQACVLLRSLTDMYKQRDPRNTGHAQFSFEDFCTTAVLTKP